MNREVNVSPRPCLVVVEDDVGLQQQLKWSLDRYELVICADREQALTAVRRFNPKVVMLDLGLPPDEAGVSEGLATLDRIVALAPSTKIIVVTGNGDRSNALQAVRRGAYDFFQKPVDPEVLSLMLDHAFRIAELEAENQRFAQLEQRSPIDGIVAVDERMVDICRKLEKIAPTDVSVLVLGESGTGKELLARALHRLSARRERRFVALNCAAIPEGLLESELFGHEKGSFTGAHKQTIGKVEAADGGTLFLDEIGDMSPTLQAKMLRFLQERVIERIGGRQEISVNLRVVCATNHDLVALIAAGRFREDLYYRLAEVTLQLPPLRERKGDITVLGRLLLQRFSKEFGVTVRGFAPDALGALEAHSWPGNIRELENKVKSAIALTDGPLINAAALGLAAPAGDLPRRTLRDVRASAERDAIVASLALADGNVSRAADLLGVSRPTLYGLLDRYGIPVQRQGTG